MSPLRPRPARCPGCEQPTTDGQDTTVIQAYARRTSRGPRGHARHTYDIRVPVTWHTACVTEFDAAREDALREQERTNVRAAYAVARAAGLSLDRVLQARPATSRLTVDECRALWDEGA